jgi:phosphoglycolate phosphatase
LSRSPRPRALLFDWDNTLVDSWATINHAWNVTLTAMGRPGCTIEETREHVRQSLRDSFPRLFGERWEEARRIYLDAFTAVHLERLTPLPAAGEMIAALAEAGYYLAVVSNKTGSVLRREAEQLGWTRHFSRLVGAGDAIRDKPSAAPIELALLGSEIAPSPSVWFVGDTGIDMECAVNGGCLPVLLGEGDPAAPEFLGFRPQLHFADCAALNQHVQGL